MNRGRSITALMGDIKHFELMDDDEFRLCYRSVELYLQACLYSCFKYSNYMTGVAHELVVTVTASLDTNRNIHGVKRKGTPWRGHDRFLRESLALAWAAMSQKERPEQLVGRVNALLITRSILISLMTNFVAELRVYIDRSFEVAAAPSKEGREWLAQFEQQHGIGDSRHVMVLVHDLQIWLAAIQSIFSEITERHLRLVFASAKSVVRTSGNSKMLDAIQDATFGGARGVRDYRPPFARLPFIKRWAATSSRSGARRSSNTIVVSGNAISDLVKINRLRWKPNLMLRMELFAGDKPRGHCSCIVFAYNDMTQVQKLFIPHQIVYTKVDGHWEAGPLVGRDQVPVTSRAVLTANGNRVGDWPARYQKQLQRIALAARGIPQKVVAQHVNPKLSVFEQGLMQAVASSSIGYKVVVVNPKDIMKAELEGPGVALKVKTIPTLIEYAVQHYDSPPTDVDRVECTWVYEVRTDDLELLSSRAKLSTTRIRRTIATMMIAHTYSLDRPVKNDHGADDVGSLLSVDQSEVDDRVHWHELEDIAEEHLQKLSRAERAALCVVNDLPQQLDPSDICIASVTKEQLRQVRLLTSFT